nr:MAG TPA: hypothetical protein [Caudoviricetes sp.]
MGHLSRLPQHATYAPASQRPGARVRLLSALQKRKISGYRFEPEPMSLSHMNRKLRDVSAQAFCFARR